MNLNDYRVGARLGAGFALVLLLVALMIFIGIWNLSSAAASMHAALQQPLDSERVGESWFREISVSASRNASIAKSSDPAYLAQLFEEAKASKVRVTELSEKLARTVDSPEEKQLLAKVAAARESYNAVRNPMLQAKSEGRQDEVDRLFASFQSVTKTYLACIAEFVQFQHHELEMRASEVDAAASRGHWALALTGASALVLGALLAWMLTRSIVAPLERAMSLAGAVEKGDLTHRQTLAGHDELAKLVRSLGSMREGLHEIVGKVRQSTDCIHTASSEVATGNLDLSVRTEQTAAMLQQTAAAMEEISSQVAHTSDSANHASQLSRSATKVAANSGEIVGRVVATMGEIASSSHKISDIIATIDGIAFQTNILALNAAVEAARAGEQGRGFAVVAGEVRTLAQRSAAAAKEIRVLIGNSVETVEVGHRLVTAAGAQMAEMVGSVKNVADIICEISASASQQTVGIQRVSTSVSELDRMTQQNAALVEQSAAAAESLRDQAGQLTLAMSGFRLS